MKYLLAIDIGNTNTTLGIFDGERIKKSWRLSSKTSRTVDEFQLVFSSLLEPYLKDGAISACIICSVVPSLTELVREAAAKFSKTPPEVAMPDWETNLTSYEYPSSAIGMDRIADAVAAYAKYPARPIVIVDAGTGLVFDAISADGVYLGGAIAPGIELATNALHAATSLLPKIELIAPGAAIGKTTKHSVQSGVVYGFADLITSMLGRFQLEMCGENGASLHTIATGGAAQFIADITGRFNVVDVDLTLSGLQILYKLRTG